MVGNRTRSSGGQPEGGKEDAEVAWGNATETSSAGKPK